MDLEQLAIEHQKTADRSLRNEGRIEKLEEEHETLHSLATSVAVMAEQMKSMNTSISTLTGQVNELKEKPGKRWDKVGEAVLIAIAGAFVGFLLSKIGL